MRPGEKLLAEIRRHPIGLVFIYLQVLAAVTAAIALVLVIAPDFLRNLSGEENTFLILFAILFVGLGVFVLLLATSVYRQNRLIITNHAVAQTLQSGPFSQKMSRLSMADVEDVTADQKGILPTIFNYGVLTVETSGELKNFVFKYCPDPNRYATLVSEARQTYAANPGSQ
jgi:hypothetical protein